MRNAIGAPLGLPAAKHNRYSGELAEFRRTLGAAMHQVDHQPHAAASMLTAFIHQVTALVRTGRLSVADGTNLITAAENLIADLAN